MRFQRSIAWAGVAVVMLSACTQSPQAKEAKYLEKGRKEFEKKNYAVAVLHFKNAAAAQPRDAEPYYQLGLTHLATRDFDSAGGYLMKATELSPKHTGAQVKLAGLMSTSRDKKVLEDGEKRVLGVLVTLPDDLEALNVLALLEVRLGKPESAESHLEQALRKSPGHLQSTVALAQARLARKDVAGAETVLQQAVAQSPKSAEPLVYLGGFYMAQGKTAEAEKQFRQALAVDPKNGGALVSLASIQVRAGQAEEAEKTFRRLASLPERQYKPMHALYLFQIGKREEAVAEFEQLSGADKTDRNLRTELVKAYLTLNRVGDAERVLTEVLKKNGLDVDALLQRSRIYLSTGKLVEAQSDLNQILHFRSDSSEAHYLLAKVGQARGDSTVQKQELGQVLRIDPNHLLARLELAQALLADRAAQPALQLMDETPQEQKSTVQAVVQRNWALLALGQKEEARQGVNKVLATGKVPEALVQDAALRLDQKDYAGARASLEAALSQTPEDLRALTLLFQTYSAQGQQAAGLQKAREYALRFPASAPVQQFVGQLHFAAGDKEGARKAFEAALVAKPGWVNADLAVAELDTKEGKHSDARKRLSEHLAAHPESVSGHLLLAQLENKEANRPAAIEQYRKVLTLDSKNALALNGLAYQLAETQKPDEALKYAQQAKQLAPESPAVDDTLGWTYFQKGMYALAVTHLEGATAKEGTALRKYHLAMAYLKAGDSKRGRQVLDSALKMDPSLPEAKAARQAFASITN